MGYEPDFEYLEVKEYGIYAFIQADSILDYGRVRIWEETDSVLRIDFISDPSNKYLYLFDSEKYVEFENNRRMNLIAPCCDRYNYHFSRKL